MKIHIYYVYILTNRTNNVLYVGVTNNLVRRISEHKQKFHGGFSSTYNCNKLVYYEIFNWIEDAIVREKKIKGGSRKKKIDLVNSSNPQWKDLSSSFYTFP